MSDFPRIARAYLSGTVAAVWCFLFLCLLGVSCALSDSTIVEEIARNQGGILGGVLSRKSYMAMFAYFNACLLGVLLRDNIAHPWACVLPHYRKKHLLVTTLIALCFIGIPMFSMEFVGTSGIAPTSIAVIFLTCLAAGLWTLHHPILCFLAFPFLVFVSVHSSSSPALTAFLAGTNPVASAALVIISLLALWVLAWRLLLLNENKFEYVIARMWGDLIRGRGGLTFQGLFYAKTFEDHLAVLPAEKRATLQNFDALKYPFTNLKHIDNLSGYNERSLWQRLQLWRLGTAPTRTSVSVVWLLLLSLICIPIMVYIPPLVGAELPARDVVVIMSVQVMTNPVVFGFPWFLRLDRLGYESLRPRTRQEFVRELGLALGWDLFLCWLGGVLCMGIAAAIWAPELIQAQNMFLFLLGTGVGQLCVYAMMGIWLSKLLKRGMVASVLCAFFPFLAMTIWILWINSRIGIELNIAIASGLAVASVATITLAYRRWCQADLD